MPQSKTEKNTYLQNRVGMIQKSGFVLSKEEGQEKLKKEFLSNNSIGANAKIKFVS